MVITVCRVPEGRSRLPLLGSIAQSAGRQGELASPFGDTCIPDGYKVPVRTFDNGRVVIVSGKQRADRIFLNFDVIARAAKIGFC